MYPTRYCPIIRNNRTRLSKIETNKRNRKENSESQFQNEILHASGGGSPRDFLDERFRSKVMSLDTLHPPLEAFQFFLGKSMETDYSWRKCDGKSIRTGRCVERRATPLGFQQPRLFTLEQGSWLWYIQDKRKSFSFPMERVSSRYPGKCLFSTNSRSRWRGTLCWPEMRCNFLR